MTGCPAWYDIEKIYKRLASVGLINKIIISDPADIMAFGNQSLELVRFMRKKFPNAEIEYVFHRGTKKDQYTNLKIAGCIKLMTEKLSEMNIPYHDIAFGYEGFSIYDNCDLHIGHRVHAHIYTLSQRRQSILLEEDSRGAGVNEALGLWGIKAYYYKPSSNASVITKVINKAVSITRPNKYALNSVNDYINYIVETKGDIFNVAFGIMEHHYEKMIEHISLLKDICR